MENIKTNVWKTGAVVGGLLALFLLAISINQIKLIFGYDSANPITNTITVSGKGEAVAIPDIATISLTITENAKTVADAQDLATNKLNAVIKAVHAEGVAEKDVKTTSYNINPHYEYNDGVCNGIRCTPGKSVITGYDVSQSLDIKVRDLSKAGKLLDVVGGLGVQNVSGLSFAIDDMDVIKEKARADAIADAKAKGAKLASQLGVRIVKIVSFNDLTDSPYGFYGMGGDSMSAKVESAVARPVPQVPAGEQKVISQVSITYEIH